MTSLAGNDVTSRFVEHGFLSLFNTCLVSIVYRSRVINVFERSIMAVCRFQPLGGDANRKQHRHSIVRPRLSISVQYTILV
jgi:hypothetical protein